MHFGKTNSLFSSVSSYPGGTVIPLTLILLNNANVYALKNCNVNCQQRSLFYESFRGFINPTFALQHRHPVVFLVLLMAALSRGYRMDISVELICVCEEIAGDGVVEVVSLVGVVGIDWL